MASRGIAAGGGGGGGGAGFGPSAAAAAASGMPVGGGGGGGAATPPAPGATGSGFGGASAGGGPGMPGDAEGRIALAAKASQRCRVWKEVRCKGNMPHHRSGAASVITSHNRLVIFGGYGGDGRLDDCWEFNFENSSWQEITYEGPSPGVRENNGVVERNNKLYLFGGYNGSRWLNDFWELDLNTRTWRMIEPKGDPPASRFGYVAMTYKNLFLLFGGYDGTTWLNDMHEYNFDTQMWTVVRPTGDIPCVRSCPAWARRGNSVYMFGGYDGVRRMNDFYEFRLDLCSWTLLPGAGKPPSPRYFHSCAVYNNCLYSFGGYNGTERLNDMHEYNFDTGRWTVISEHTSTDPSMPSGRSSLIAQVHGHSLYIFGGYNGHMVLNDFYEYRFEPVSIPPPTLVHDLRTLINNPELSDVTFLVEERRVYASRIHLASRSAHFKAMLFGGMRESQTDVGDIPLPDLSYDVFMKMLEFLYTDNVEELDSALAIPLLMASERYLLDRLKGLCEDAIRKSINSSNVVSVFMAAHRHRAADLKEICLEFIIDALDEVRRSESFKELRHEPDLLLEIIMRQPGGPLGLDMGATGANASRASTAVSRP